MPHNGDSDQPIKKISTSDLADAKPRTAPVLQGAPEDDEPEAPEAPAVDEGKGEDAVTDKAVEDIVKKEGDEALKAQDEAAEKSVPAKVGFGAKLRNFF